MIREVYPASLLEENNHLSFEISQKHTPNGN